MPVKYHVENIFISLLFYSYNFIGIFGLARSMFLLQQKIRSEFQTKFHHSFAEGGNSKARRRWRRHDAMCTRCQCPRESNCCLQAPVAALSAAASSWSGAG